MKNIGTVFLFTNFIILTSINCYASTANCDENNNCDAGYYCTQTGGGISGITQNICQKCPDPFSSSNSSSNSTKESCYYDCPKNLIINGNLVGTISYDSKITTQDAANSECKKNAILTCDSGYHAEKDATGEQFCENNIQSCTCSDQQNATECQKEYDNGWGQCTPTKCKPGYVLINNSCINSSQACKGLSGCNGDISGNASTTPTGKTEYSGCTCTEPIKDFSNGEATRTYNHDPSKDGGWSDNYKIEINTCDAGYCRNKDKTACTAAPHGEYSHQYEKDCNSCPYGSTTKETMATDIKECVYIRGPNGTKFCDNSGCFYLPAPPETSYNQENKKFIRYIN